MLQRISKPAHERRAEIFRLPKGLFALILGLGIRYQLGLAAITTVLFLVSAVPLELQRRIVNDAIGRGDIRRIGILSLTYAGVALLQGAVKLCMNVCRGWVGENATRYLRTIVVDAVTGGESGNTQEAGVEVAIVLAETDPVGTFVGVSVSEPLLQCGILVTILSYMTWLQPWMALFALSALVPQLVYVPAFQNRINRRAASRVLTLRRISTMLSEPGKMHPSSSALDLIRRVFDLNMSIYKIKYLLNFLMNGSFHLSMAGILALGGYYVAKGEIDVGGVIACAGGLSRLNDPWGDLVDWFRELRVTQAKFALIRSAGLGAPFHSELSGCEEIVLDRDK
ncbi:MAG: ABC transporter ATP-binding protein [Hyphomicrobiales bacterium]|nr:ABC transporter ATP-binding protein [Hyphomicrobiales bacterium]